MTYLEFDSLVRALFERTRADTAYLDALPAQVSEFIVGTPYAESLCEQLELLGASAFGEHWPDVRWFLQDWRPGFDVTVRPGTALERVYPIADLEGYLRYARAELFRS